MLKKTRLELHDYGDSDFGENVMLVMLWWWPIWDVGDRIIMLAIFFVMLMIFLMYKISP